MTDISYKKIAIIGLGLLGGSIARAVKKHLSTLEIYGYDICSETRQKALEIGFLDYAADTLQETVQKADLVILATPISCFGPISQEIIPYMKAGADLCDTGSVKQAVIDMITPHLHHNPHINFIPAHPIAGTEKSGVDAGFASLFENRMVVLCPLEGTHATDIEPLEIFWRAIGAQIQHMTPQHHDMVFAIVSHIPHLIAYNIVGTANHLEKISEQEVISYSASGFRDFTRLASSDPTIWRDVFLNNREAVLEMLGRFIEDLFDLQRAIRYEDGDYLFKLFSETRNIRQKIIDAGQETHHDNFGRHHL